MALPICIELPEIPDPFALPLPGGVEIEDINLMQMIQPALSPLVPLFNLVDVLVAVFNCLKAIPDALGPPPDPRTLAACLPELAEKLSQLLNLLPQVALPRLLKRLLALLISTLRTVRSKLLHLQQQLAQILGAIDRAKELDDAGLMAIIQCAEANVAQEARNVGKNLASLGKLIGLVNLFLGLLGLPGVPDFRDLAGRPLDGVIAPLDALIDVFEAAEAAIPLP